jgi:hypothetical protein
MKNKGVVYNITQLYMMNNARKCIFILLLSHNADVTVPIIFILKEKLKINLNYHYCGIV